MLDKFKSMLDEIKIVTYEFISVFDFNQQFSALRPLQSSEKKMGDLIKTLILHIKQDSVLSFPFPFIALYFDRNGQCFVWDILLPDRGLWGQSNSDKL